MRLNPYDETSISSLTDIKGQKITVALCIIDWGVSYFVWFKFKMKGKRMIGKNVRILDKY